MKPLASCYSHHDLARAWNTKEKGGRFDAPTKPNVTRTTTLPCRKKYATTRTDNPSTLSMERFGATTKHDLCAMNVKGYGILSRNNREG